MAGIVIGAVAGAAVSGIFGLAASNRQASAQRDLYNAQYAAQSRAAMADAEARMKSARSEAEALLAGAEAQAGAVLGAAEANARSVRTAGSAEYEASKQAADLAYAEAYKNVNLMKQEADEELRRLDQEQTVYEEKSRARAAASGGEYTGSTKAYVEGMITENDKQYGWLKNAFANQRSVAMSNANADRQARYGYADALRTAANSQADAYLQAGRLEAGAITAGAWEQANASQEIARAQQSATWQTYGGPTSGRWYNQAVANATAAKKQGQPFSVVLANSPGYEYAAAKVYGRV